MELPDERPYDHVVISHHKLEALLNMIPLGRRAEAETKIAVGLLIAEDNYQYSDLINLTPDVPDLADRIVTVLVDADFVEIRMLVNKYPRSACIAAYRIHIRDRSVRAHDLATMIITRAEVDHRLSALITNMMNDIVDNSRFPAVMQQEMLDLYDSMRDENSDDD